MRELGKKNDMVSPGPTHLVKKSVVGLGRVSYVCVCTMHVCIGNYHCWEIALNAEKC